MTSLRSSRFRFLSAKQEKRKLGGLRAKGAK